MKTIEVSDEMHDFLMELSKEINSQDHRCTAMPYFFQIQTKKEVPSPEGCGNEAWYKDDNTIESEEEINQEIFEIKEEQLSIDEIKKLDNWEKEEILEGSGWRKIYYTTENQYENAFFTAKACELHIKKNDYHYREPVSYLQGAWRNPEMEMIMKFLCELSGGKLHT
jgi:hypothetical protein